MKVLVNNKEKELPVDATISILATHMQLPERGIAIAVNNKMISRQEWTSFALNENDNIVIVKAACGG